MAFGRHAIFPIQEILPEEIGISPKMVISSDVLPLPTGPVIPTSCPLVALKDMLSKVGRSDV